MLWPLSHRSSVAHLPPEAAQAGKSHEQGSGCGVLGTGGQQEGGTSSAVAPVTSLIRHLHISQMEEQRMMGGWGRAGAKGS